MSTTNDVEDVEPAAPTGDEKRVRVTQLPWFHTLDLGDGVITPGHKSSEQLSFESDRAFRMPIAGQSVLEVGCWDGHFSFEARRRGATRVLATDHYVWSAESWGNRGSFEFARQCIDPAIEMMEIKAEEVSVETVGTFDVVLFLGVFYHLRDPLPVVDRLSAIAQQMLVLETHVDLRLAPEPPAMAYYPTDELNGDVTNWWGPNVSCVRAMLAGCGFNKIVEDEHYGASCPSRLLMHAIR